MNHKMTMAVLGMLEEKQHTGMRALGGLCFLGVAHIPAALHLGTTPSVQLLNFNALKYLNNLKPKKPMVRSGRREVKSLPQAEPGATHSKVVWTARLQNCSQNYKLLLANCVARRSMPETGFPSHPRLASCQPTPLRSVWTKCKNWK